MFLVIVCSVFLCVCKDIKVVFILAKSCMKNTFLGMDPISSCKYPPQAWDIFLIKWSKRLSVIEARETK